MKFIIGADEAGRGCIAGNIFGAAAVIKKETKLVFCDSKKMSKQNRKDMILKILKDIDNGIIDYSISFKTPFQINRIGLGQANKDIFIDSIDDLISKLYNDYGQDIKIEVIVDGNLKLSSRKYPNIEFKSVVKADDSYQSVSLASVFAKSAKDGEMFKISKDYPSYGFQNHSGYDTKAHREALDLYGPIQDVHRVSTKTIQKYL